MEPIVSEPYSIGRLELAYAAAGLYIRSFWWALVGMPLGGFAILFTMRVPIMDYLGAVMVLWPITIPGRALIITADQRRLYMRRTIATLRDDGLYLDPDGATSTRVPLSWIYRVVVVGDKYGLQSHRGRVVWIKRSAFPEEKRPVVDSILKRGRSDVRSTAQSDGM